MQVRNTYRKQDIRTGTNTERHTETNTDIHTEETMNNKEKNERKKYINKDRQKEDRTTERQI